jgi:hypothetical protein
MLTEDDMYEMTSVLPQHTGLPKTIWISLRGYVQINDCRAFRRRPETNICMVETESIDIVEFLARWRCVQANY